MMLRLDPVLLQFLIFSYILHTPLLEKLLQMNTKAKIPTTLCKSTYFQVIICYSYLDDCILKNQRKFTNTQRSNSYRK